MGDPTRPPPTRRRRWVRRLAILAILAGGLFAARGPLLRGYAGLLVVDESGGPADAVYPKTGTGRLADAARMFHAGEVSRVLLGPGPDERLPALGLVADRLTAGRQQLGRVGVPDSAMTALGRPDRDDWEGLLRVADWLRANAGSTVVLLCDRYESRKLRVIADRLLGSDAARVRLRPLPHRRFTDADWWRVEDGRKEVVMQSLRLIYVLVAGDRSTPYPPVWEPDAYEASLK